MKDPLGVGARPGGAAAAVMAGMNDIVHAQTRALLAYWQGLRGDRRAPRRNELDPRQMGCDIGNLFIIEVLESGAQRFRVAGSRMVDAFGIQLREAPVHSIMEGKARDSLTAMISETLAEPGIGYARLRPAAGESQLWEMLLLPLFSDSGRLDRLVGLMFQLAGGSSLRRRTPLKLTFERMSIQPIGLADAPAGQAVPLAGFAERQGAFSGMPAPAGPARLTAIDGGLGIAGRVRRNSRPNLRVIEGD